MNLSDVYAQQVKKNSLSGFSGGSFGMPPIEKDPIINQLEQDVFAKMHEVDKLDHPTPIPEPIIKPSLKAFSFEDALRELIEIQNKNNSQ